MSVTRIHLVFIPVIYLLSSAVAAALSAQLPRDISLPGVKLVLDNLKTHQRGAGVDSGISQNSKETPDEQSQSIDSIF